MSREWPTEGGAQEIDVGTFDWPASTGSCYIACWVWFDAMGSTDIRFISKASTTSASGHRWMLGTNFSGGNDILRFRARIGGIAATYLSTNSALTGLTSQWVHCAVRYDGSNVTLWVNGVDVTSTTYARTGSMTSGNTEDVFIGNQPGSGGSSNAINGRLADMILTEYVPTGAELLAFVSGVPHSRLLGKGNVTGYWPLLGQGSGEPDLSGNGRNGTVDSGITVANQPPLAPLFGFDEPFGAFEAAGGGAFTLTADAGSYAWTGQAANLEYHSVVSAAAGSYAWTGQAANLNLGTLVSAESGSYAWTGQDATLVYDSLVAAEAGSYAWTGQEANLERHAVLEAGAGSYAWTGQDAGLNFGSSIAAEAASYAWTGQNAGLIRDSILSAAAGSYAWTGQDATLTFLAGNTLIADAGSYAWTGQDASLLRAALAAAASASYAWTGQDAALAKAILLSAESGSYAWTGNDLGFLVNSLLKADAGSYLWTGQDVTLTYDTGEVLGGGRKRRYILPDGKATTDPEEALAEFRRQVAEEYDRVIPPKSRRKVRKLKKQGLEIPTIPEMVAALPEPGRFDPILVKEASIVVEDDEDAILAILSIL